MVLPARERGQVPGLASGIQNGCAATPVPHLFFAVGV